MGLMRAQAVEHGVSIETHTAWSHLYEGPTLVLTAGAHGGRTGQDTVRCRLGSDVFVCLPSLSLGLPSCRGRGLSPELA